MYLKITKLFYIILIINLTSCVKSALTVSTTKVQSKTNKGSAMLLEKIIKDITAKAQANKIHYQLPAYKKITLDNGLQIIFIKDALPYVHFNLRINAGQRFEDKAGLSVAVANLLDKGTSQLSRAEIAQSLDQLGASFSARAEEEFSWVQASGLAKNDTQLMHLFWQLLSQSIFKKTEWLKEQKILLADLTNLPASSSQFLHSIFKSHAYANTVYKTQTKSSIKSLKQTDLLSFYKTYYQPQLASLVVLGQYTKQLKTEIIKKFSTWPKGGPVTSTKNSNTTKLNSSIILINKSDSSQANVIIASPLAMTYGHPDRLAASLANFSLGGGGFNSRLLNKVRKKEGLTYGISSGISLLKNYGYFQIHTSTNQGSLEKLLTVSFKELKTFYQNGVSQAELDFAKLFYSNQLFGSLEKKENLMASFLSLEGMGKDPDNYLTNFASQVEAVDLKTVNTAIKKYFNPENMQIFILANKDSKGGETNIQNKNEHSVLKQLQNFSKNHSSHKNITVTDYTKVNY